MPALGWLLNLDFAGGGTATATIPIVALPKLAPARVYLHDGWGRELCQLTQVRDVSRSFILNDGSAAQFAVAETDPQFSELAPAQGRIVTIRSVNHPLIWAGELISVEAPAATHWVTCRARSLESLLDWSDLEVARTVEGEAGAIVRTLLEDANRVSPLGITVAGDLEAGWRLPEPLRLGARRLRSAIDEVVQAANMEWWLEHELDGTQLVNRLHLARRRGRSLFGHLLMAGPGGNISERPAWRESVEGGVHALRVIGGAESASTEFGARASARFQLGDAGRVPTAEIAALDDVHGFPPDESFAGLSPVTSRQATRVIEFMRGSTAARALAETLLTHRRAVSRAVNVQVAPNPQGEAFWASYVPGNILRLIVDEPVFRTGIDAPVRVLGVQPMERSATGEGGFCNLVLELRGRPSDAATR